MTRILGAHDWKYLCRAIDRDGTLADVMLSGASQPRRRAFLSIRVAADTLLSQQLP
jgi:transposase-like protein